MYNNLNPSFKSVLSLLFFHEFYLTRNLQESPGQDSSLTNSKDFFKMLQIQHYI